MSGEPRGILVGRGRWGSTMSRFRWTLRGNRRGRLPHESRRHRTSGCAGQRGSVARPSRSLPRRHVPAAGRRHTLPRAHSPGPRRELRQGSLRAAALDLRAEGFEASLGNVLATGAAARRARSHRHDQDQGPHPRRRPVPLHVQPALLQGPALAPARRAPRTAGGAR